MKTEKLFYAIGEIDEELVMEALEPAQPVRRRTAWIKWAAIAACLLLLLTPQVRAAVRELWLEFSEASGFWNVHTDEKVPLSDFSPEVLALADNLGTGSGIFPLESMEEAQTLLGGMLPENPLLSNSNQDILYMETEDRFYESPCILRLHNDNAGQLSRVHVEVGYKIDGVPVSVFYDLTTDRNDSESSGVWYQEESDQKTYTTPSDLECILTIQYSGYADFGYIGTGYAVIDGIMTVITVRHTSESTVETTLTQILDAFG